MQTFTVKLGVDIRAVITQEFLDESRKEALAEDATPFLKEAQARFPEDDDQFMLAIVCNAFRTYTRQTLLDFMLKSGVGGTVAPVTITERVCAVPKEFSQTAPSDVIDKPLKPTTLTLGFDPGTPGQVVHHWVEAVG